MTRNETSLAFACRMGMCVGVDNPECCLYGRHREDAAAKKLTGNIFSQPKLWRKLPKENEIRIGRRVA